MKPVTLTSKRLLLPLIGACVVALLVSWDLKQTGNDYQQQQTPTDTVPKKKKNDRKVRDLDDVLAELDAVDIDKEMEKAREDMAKAFKEIDAQKIQLDVQKALQEVNFDKIKADIDKAMKEVDFDKIKKEVQESIAKIDFDKIKADIDLSKMKIDMDKMQEELKELGPKLQKELAKAEIDLSKAKEEIEKAKAEIKEYKVFVDQLDSDGLINKKENYSLQHKDGELKINGKKVSDAVYSKYKSFLEKHKNFNIEKSADDFDIDMD